MPISSRSSSLRVAMATSVFALAVVGGGCGTVLGGHAPGTTPPSPVSSSGVTGYVYADTNGYAPNAGLAGASVSVYDDCTSLESMTCAFVASTTTNAAGFFGLDLTSASGYYAVVSRDSTSEPFAPEGFGGAVQGFTAPTSSPLNIDVYPFVPYGNASFVLPGYVCMSSYLNNVGTDGPGCQNPVLSWTQDGAYYVNASDELVFYSFVNNTIYPIVSWIPLYQTFASYAMIPNELFITQDGSYVYGWGEENPSTGVLTVEAVNVTTHRVFLYDFTEVDASDASTSGQLLLTGWDGNDSQAVLIVGGTVYDHDLWSDSETDVTQLPFFEANNIYWMPYLNGFIDVEADGSSGDLVAEFQLNGPVSSSSDFALEETYSAPWTNEAIVVNGVNGVSFNVTNRELSVQAENSGLVYSVLPNGTISQLLEVTNLDRDGSCVCVALGPTSESDRPLMVASGPELSMNYNGFVNDSWLTLMTPGQLGYYSTNQSPWPYNPDASFGTVYSSHSWYQEGQFLNASYIIPEEAYACDSAFPGSCPINGTHGVARGTIWWLWKLGLPEFPYSALSPAADDLGPAPTDVTSARVSGSNATLEWTPIANDAILNYTVAWGTSPGGLTNFASVPGYETSFTITGLAPNTRYYDSVEAWNLHFHGNGTGIATFYSAPEVTQLEVTGSNETNVSLAWTNPPAGSFTNLTVEYGASPGALVHHVSVGEVANFTATGLGPGSTYFFDVVAWNGTVQGVPSNLAQAGTTFVGATDLSVTGIGVTNVSLAWTNPASGTFTNLTVEYGTVPDSLTDHRSVGTVATYSANGLLSSTMYYFEVIAWNGTVTGRSSNVVNALTSFTGATYLTVTSSTNRSISLAWTNPAAGTFTNLTVEYGTAQSALSSHVSAGPVSSYIATGLASSTTYYFEVLAWNGTNEGLGSNEVSASTGVSVPPIKVGGASDLTVTGSTSDRISLSWTNPPSGTFTNLTLEYGPSSTSLSSHLSVGTGSSYIVAGLAASTTYYFEVVAWNGTVAGPPSNEVIGSTASSASSSSSSGPSWTEFYALGAVVAALAVTVAALLLRRRRTRPPAPTAGSGSPSTGPPPGSDPP